MGYHKIAWSNNIVSIIFRAKTNIPNIQIWIVFRIHSKSIAISKYHNHIHFTKMVDGQLDRCEASKGSSVTLSLSDTSPSDTSGTNMGTIQRPIRSVIWKQFDRRKEKLSVFCAIKFWYTMVEFNVTVQLSYKVTSARVSLASFTRVTRAYHACHSRVSRMSLACSEFACMQCNSLFL